MGGINGPSPFSECRFPFEWKGKLHTNCTKEPTPSGHNPACKELLDSVGDDINLETPGARIKLVIENQSRSKGNSAKLSKRKKDNRKKSTSCYTNLDQHHGWCAT